MRVSTVCTECKEEVFDVDKLLASRHDQLKWDMEELQGSLALSY